MSIKRLPTTPLALTLALIVLISVLGGVPTRAATSSVPSGPADYQPSFPINAAFFYAVQRINKTKVHPSKHVDYADAEVIRNQIDDMMYAGQAAGIYSWFGIGSYPDRMFNTHLRAADGSPFRWALLDENEGGGRNPSVNFIRNDLNYIYARYAKDPNYLRIGGKPVLFTYGDPDDTCNAAARWMAGDYQHRFFIVMRAVDHYQTCSPAPQSWYGYVQDHDHYRIGNSFEVSPGFDDAYEKAPRLARNVERFQADLEAMKRSSARFHLTTTWNEWTEATGVESAREWRSKDGHGRYVDMMHAVLGGTTGVSAPAALAGTSTSDGVKLSWTKTSGAISYEVFRNGCLAARVTGTTWTDEKVNDMSAAYYVETVGSRNVSRRGPLKIASAGKLKAAPKQGSDSPVALAGERLLSTGTGTGVGCYGRQRGAQVLTMPSSVPKNATAVELTLTSLNSLGNGTIQVFPAGVAAPPVHQLRYYSYQASSNTVVVPIGTARQIVLQQTGAATHYTVDLIGYTVPHGAGLAGNPATQAFIDTRNNTGGVGRRKISGTITALLPSFVPADVTGVEVRLLVTGATANGNAVAFEGATSKPGITSLSYSRGATDITSVLVPVGATRQISINVSSSANVVAGVEGWILRGGRKLTAQTPTRMLAGTTRVRSARVRFPAADQGRLALLNVGVASSLGYGSLSVHADGSHDPQMQTVSFGPLSPQSGFVWVRVPSNGIVDLSLTQRAIVFVDQVALA